jgi:hypothetical protein
VSPPPSEAPELTLRCPCGERLRAAGEDAMVELANAHLAEVHPELAGEYTREQILVMTY